MDPMTGQPAYRQFTVRSTNELTLRAPYEGPNRGELLLQIGRLQGGLRAMLRIDKGQFVCSAQPCLLRFRVDDDPPFNVAAIRPKDGSPDVLVLDVPAQLLEGMTRGNRIYVEATYFQAGDQVLKFDTPGGSLAAVERSRTTP